MTTPLSDSIRDSYDAVPYLSVPQYWTHPNCLATVATLMGMEPAAPAECRVLELGCGTGGNLIPMAVEFPESEFVGVDLSPRQIEFGQGLIDGLDLTSVRLEAMDLTDIDESFGSFDYIICHGVFSWVPTDVQERIFQICRQKLTPMGVAYISYNTHPGSQARDLARGVARFGSKRLLAEGRDASQIVALWHRLAEAMPTTDHPVAGQLTEVADELEVQDEHYLIHEYLEDVNEPLWFYEFAERAQAQGLQYLAEAAKTRTLDDFPEHTQKILSGLSGSLIDREQLLDLAANQAFRRSLLCHAEVELTRSPAASTVMGLRATAGVSPVSVQQALSSAGSGGLAFRSRSGWELKTNIPVLSTALNILHEKWPESVGVEDLWGRALKAGPEVVADAGPTSTPEFFASAMLQCWLKNAVVLGAQPFPVTGEPGARPEASSLARLQLHMGLPIANLLHQAVDPSAPARGLLKLLDGSRDVDELRTAWEAAGFGGGGGGDESGVSEAPSDVQAPSEGEALDADDFGFALQELTELGLITRS